MPMPQAPQSHACVSHQNRSLSRLGLLLIRAVPWGNNL